MSNFQKFKLQQPTNKKNSNNWGPNETDNSRCIDNF